MFICWKKSPVNFNELNLNEAIMQNAASAQNHTVFILHPPFPLRGGDWVLVVRCESQSSGCGVQSDFSVSYEQTNRGEYKWQRRENQTTVFATFPPSGRIESLQTPHRYASRTWCQAARVKVGYEKKTFEIWLFLNDPHVAVKTQRHLIKKCSVFVAV